MKYLSMHEAQDESKDESCFELFLEVFEAEKGLSLVPEALKLFEEPVVVEPQQGLEVEVSLLLRRAGAEEVRQFVTRPVEARVLQIEHHNRWWVLATVGR